MKKTYSEKLKDPRWQKKRLEIMNIKNFSCEDCASKEKTLNIHHIIYRKGKSPWEYEDYEFKCLCEECHEKWHFDRNEFNENIAEIEIQGLGIEELYWFASWKANGCRDALRAVFESICYDIKKQIFNTSGESK